MTKGNTTNDFIKKSKAKFGDKFDYANTIYVNAKTDVTIKCTEHDYELNINSNNHLKSKDGCNRQCKLYGKGVKRQLESERCKKEGILYKKHKCSRCKGSMDDFFKNIHDNCKIKTINNYENRKKTANPVAIKKVKAKPKSIIKKVTVSICEYIYGDKTHCKYKAKRNIVWCGKHERKGRIEQEISDGINHCPNWNRGCNNILQKGCTSYACDECKKINNIKDKERRDKHASITVSSLLGLKHCLNCNKDKPKNGFVKLNGNESRQCADCLEKSRIAEKKRPPRKRDFSEYESKPEVKKMRKEWAQHNNDKTTRYYKDARKRARDSDPIQYLEKGAKMQREWRKNNPEKAKKNDERWKGSDGYKISYYKTSAKAKGVSFELSDEYIIKCIHSKCWYCGMSPDEVNMGIDRLNPDGLYSEKNTEPCCSPCNYSKKDYTVSQYIGKIFQILSCIFPNSNIEQKQYTKDIKNPTSYRDAKDRAEKRNKHFYLTEKEYNSLIQNTNSCYLCGDILESGMSPDRVNNDIGYCMSNCKPCCSMCNYMKKDSSLKNFINRCVKIWMQFENYDTSHHLQINQRGGSMNPRITEKLPDISRRDKALIRNELKNTDPEWIRASTRKVAGIATKEDDVTLRKIERQITDKINEERLKLYKEKEHIDEERKRKQREYRREYRKKKNVQKKPRGRPKKDISDEERKRKQKEKMQRYRNKKRLLNPPNKIGRPKKDK